MPTRSHAPRLIWLLALLATPLVAGDEPRWPGFRGPAGRGVVEGAPAPTSWDREGGEGIRWITEIPGLGLSSPVVWGDRVFVTTAVGKKERPRLKVGLYGDIAPVKSEGVLRFEVYALDRRTGEILWQRTAHEGEPAIQRHPKSSHANSTPATDGERVIAMFGSEGLHAFDMQGEPLWNVDLGTLDSGYFRAPEAQWGFGSSPRIHQGKVLLQVDVQEGSFLAAYDVTDGSEIWRVARDEVPGWSTPTVHGSQVLVNGWKHIGGYELATGREIWRMRGAGDIPVPTPYVVDDLIFLTSAHGGGRPVYAVRTSARGDVTLAEGQTRNEHVAWSDPRGGSYLPTSLVYRDLLYVLRGNGVLSVREFRTGELVYQERVGGGSLAFTASPVATDGKIYLTSEEGDVVVLKAGRAHEVLSTSSLAEICMATPAIAAGDLLFRTRRHVIAVGDRP